MEIREYRPTDLAGCMQIMQSNIPEYFHEGDLADFAGFLANLPGPYLVVIESTSGLVACGGIALGKKSATEAVLCYGMVAGTRLRQGLGRELLRKRLELFLPRQPQVELLIVNTTQKTEGFFRRFGFVVVGREPDGYGPGLDHVSLAAAKSDVLRLLDESLLS